MEDHHHQGQKDPPNSPNQGNRERSEPVRSRWTPKPEQILILESIFNSGMVNPPKDETVRIRKLLEKFGAVGDANVFYWFQNRRSRSRRRQRLMQATLDQQRKVMGANANANNNNNNNNNNPCYFQTSPSVVQANMGFGAGVCSGAGVGGGGSTFSINSNTSTNSAYSFLSGSSSSCVGGGQDGFGVGGGFFSTSAQMGFPEIDQSSSTASSVLYPSGVPNLNYHSGFGGTNISGFITVFINGVATEVPRGPVDFKTAFGEDVMLVHSSGISLPTNEFGFLTHSLQHGESYFLVAKQTQV